METTKPKITLATLPMATAQDVFDQVAEHLLTQKERSMRHKTDKQTIQLTHVCAYRGKGESGNDCQCAAGCLISDEEYAAWDFEGASWHGLVLAERVPPQHEDLIAKLQVLHDGTHPSLWLAELHTLAQRLELSIKVLEKFQ